MGPKHLTVQIESQSSLRPAEQEIGSVSVFRWNIDRPHIAVSIVISRNFSVTLG